MCFGNRTFTGADHDSDGNCPSIMIRTHKVWLDF